MKGARIVLTLIVFCITTFCISDVVSARSKSLTTTIMITVKPDPKGNLLPNDKNTEIIKEETQDVKSSVKKIYTITDRL